MSREFEAYQSQRFFGSLSGVRCFSILAVMWHHSGHPDSPAISTRGFLGVDMFFVLSGFLIVTLLLREKQRTGGISLVEFYIRRTLRIFPIYYGVLLVLAGAYWFFKRDDPDTVVYFTLLPFHLAYLTNWTVATAANLGITWSLAAEEQFYLVWPVLEKLVKRKWMFAIIGLVFVVNQLINFDLLDPLFARLYGMEEAPDLEILDATFTPICLGVALAHLLHRPGAFDFLYRCLGRRWTPVALLVTLLAAINYLPGDISGWPRLVIQLLMFVWLGSLLVREDHALRGFLTLRPIERLGEISYGMYLYHLWAFYIASAVNDSIGWKTFPALFVTGLLVTVAISELSFRFYETPILKQKDGLIRRWRNRKAA